MAGETILLPEANYEAVDVISPQLGEKLLSAEREYKKAELDNVIIVAECFRVVLEDYGYARYFDHICFAIYGKEDGKNITAFRKSFKK